MNLNFCPLGIHIYHPWSVYELKSVIDKSGNEIGKVMHKSIACKKCGFTKIQSEEVCS